MAKITAIKTALLVATVLTGASFSTPALAQTDQELLDMAQEAEGNRYWPAAEKFYRQMLQRNPNRADLWERLGDIIAVQGRAEEAAEVFAKAADLVPGNAQQQIKASQAMAMADNPKEAAKYTQRALDLDPENLELIDNQAFLQTWAGDNAGAEETLLYGFERGLEQNEENLIRLAKVQVWQDKIKEARAVLKKIEKINPQHLGFLLLNSQVFYTKGDYKRALDNIDAYLAAGGDPFQYVREKSLYLAWANNPEASLKLSSEGLAENPDEIQLVTSQVIAYLKNREFEKSLEALDLLDSLTDTGPDAQFARRIVGSQIRSNLDLSFTASTDRDHVFILGGQAVATYALKPGTNLRFGFEGYRARGRVGSGLERIDGVKGIFKTGFWGEVEAPLSKKVWVTLKGGLAQTDFANHRIFKGGFTLNARTSDKTILTGGFDRDFFLVSARALSLKIIKNETFVRIQHLPDANWYTSFRFSYSTLSDSNRQTRADLTLIRKTVRNQDFNMDVGFSATWFGYKFTFANGYYNPSFLQQYFVPIYFYFKFSDDDGLNLTLSPGIQKDNTMSGFQPAFAASAELTLGFFKDYMFKAKIEGFYGGAGAITMIGDYWIVGGGVRLVKRF